MSFERRVQAQRMLAMCLGSKNCHGVLPGYRIVELVFQARVHEYNTDDLVCFIEDDYGNKARVLMQMKSTLAPSDPAFKEAVGLAWLDFKSGTATANIDRIVIAYDVSSSTPMQGAVEIARLALASTSAANFETKTTEMGVSSERKRKALLAVKTAVNHYNEGTAATLDEVFQFLRHIDFLHHDLSSDSTEAAATSRQLIEWANRMSGRSPIPADMVWAKLQAVCAELNGIGSEVNLSNIFPFIGSELDGLFAAFRQCQDQQQPITSVAVHVNEPRGAPVGLSVAPFQAGSVGGTRTQRIDLIPSAREASTNKLISRRLDSIATLTKGGRYRDALRDLDELGQGLDALDAHQLARWYLIRATAVWNVHGSQKEAAEHFLKAAELCDDEDKLAAARVRGHLLNENFPTALKESRAALERFPSSLTVWTAFTNARILSGERVTVEDIPAAHADEAAAYEVVASSARQLEDIPKALDLALVALDKKDATFFTREAALRYALEEISKNPLNIIFRIRDQKYTKVLARLVDSFSPREDKLWAVQSTEYVAAAATHLAWANILLGCPEEAMNIAQEVAARGVDTHGAIVRPQLEALRTLNREHDALTFGEPLLGTMAADTLVSYAQLAGDVLDMDTLEKVVANVKFREDLSAQRSELLNTLSVIRWDAMLRESQDAQVRVECVNQNVLKSESFEQAVVAARAFLRLSDPKAAQPYINLTRSLAKMATKPGVPYLFAQVLMEAKNYREAGDVLSCALPKFAFSEPHSDLLYCYLRTGQRAKAHELIKSFPEGWTNDRNARHLALELGQQCGDWSLVRSLVEPQLLASPTASMSWLLKFLVAMRDGPDAAADALRGVPERLDGRIRELSQLGSSELRHGQADAGLRRLYRLRRANLDSIEAAAAYFSAIAFAPSKLSAMADMVDVQAGASVLLVNDTGQEFWRTIDPLGMGDLPPTEEFLRTDSEMAKRLLGLKVGQTIVNRDPFGNEVCVSVKAIISAFQRLNIQSDEALRGPMAEGASIGRVPMLDQQGRPTPEPMVHELKKQAARSDAVFDDYGASAFTLGGLGRMLGTSELDLVRAWPSTGPQLESGGGLAVERQLAVENFMTARRCIIDVSALTELALVGQLDILGNVPCATVTATTRDFIEQQLTELRMSVGGGRLFLHEGHLAFIQHTDEFRTQEKAFFESICDAISKYTTVVPAYGPCDVNEVLAELGSVLSAPEYSSILAALEHEAVLVSLDARLRAYAGFCGVRGVYPQALLLALRSRGYMRPLDYSLAMIQMTVLRRNFIALDASDLEAAVDQGQPTTDIFVNHLRIYLSDDSVEFTSAAKVVIEFLARIYRRGDTQFGVVLELFSYLLEPLLRHKDCTPGFEQDAVDELLAQLGNAATEPKAVALRSYSEFALKRSKRASVPVHLKARVAYCTLHPTLCNGLSIDADLAEEVVRQAVSAEPDQAMVGASTNTNGGCEAQTRFFSGER